MNEDRDIVLFRIDRKAGILLAGVLAVVLGGFALSEQLTLTTSYPVPSGIYNQLITTGNSGTVPADTTFNRNAGNTILAPDATNAGGKVGIGTASPVSKLEVSGTATARYLQVNAVAAEGAACSSNGLVARDAAGLLLSCRSLVWTGPGSTLSGSLCGVGYHPISQSPNAATTYTPCGGASAVGALFKCPAGWRIVLIAYDYAPSKWNHFYFSCAKK